MKIKVIELLNKIANEEKVPEYVAYFNREDEINDKMMVCEENIVFKLNGGVILLNDEVEIIEEEKNIETEELIEKMSKLQSEIDLLSNEIGGYHNKIHSMRDRNTYMKETLKEIIKEVNKLKGD